jgi:hypothetical protein
VKFPYPFAVILYEFKMKKLNKIEKVKRKKRGKHTTGGR